MRLFPMQASKMVLLGNPMICFNWLHGGGGKVVGGEYRRVDGVGGDPHRGLLKAPVVFLRRSAEVTPT